MPELPEVETIKNTVKNALNGAVILNVQVNKRRLRDEIPADFEQSIAGAKISDMRRIAKYMLIDLDNGLSIICHFGMSGKFRIESVWPENPQKHDHVIISTDKGVLIYNDARRFGLITYCESANLKTNRYLCKLGLDPWDSELTSEYLLQKFKNRKTAVKLALLDQEIICGIGNIYASEILYKARIHPERPCESINKAEAEKIIRFTQEVLEESIAAGGSTIHDFKRPDGDIGYFQEKHCVYNKTGKQCPDCNCHLNGGGIRKIVQGGRSTFFCPNLQK
ncbi:MAG: bifunctional DNA-formamidopyrimidine glycosylase/DNA-(apurinic or apyrimidinic site) lyase [Alphaproteobacteria bacterium]|nr:bifunctional DNA-formamidopyrimidine glycosylase/DNA-(apurinic or apyrimidinic site) lyase [Alphaproteobacteria bacterium]